MDEVLVSVILPTYNRKEYLPRAIDSVLQQDVEGIELIVVDDGSTDGTKELMEQYSDERIRYMRTPVNRGVANARNAGIRRAKGKYIAFQDSDDVWVQGKLKAQIKAIEEADEETALSYHIMARITPDGKRRLIPDEKLPMEKRVGKIYEQLLRVNHIGAPAICVKREALTGPDGVGVFDTVMPNLEDYDLVLRLAKKYKIAYVDEVLIETYQLNDGTNTNLSNGIVSKCMILGKYREDLEAIGSFDRCIASLREVCKIAHMEEVAEAAIRKFCP